MGGMWPGISRLQMHEDKKSEGGSPETSEGVGGRMESGKMWTEV